MAAAAVVASRPRAAWSLGEEIAHAVSHGVGVVLALVGLPLLVAVAVLHGSAWHVTAAAVFGTSLVLLYSASTLYHAIPNARAKRVLRVLDHSSIYLAIAGTYTPFALGPLRGPWGWTLLAVVWSGAVAGIVFKSLDVARAPILSTVVYAAMGWCVVVALGPLVRAVAPAGLILLFAGGLCYTLGIVFYAWQRRFHHFVWHLFVLAGSVLHYLAVFFFAIPRAG
jgi:hemolysin III